MSAQWLLYDGAPIADALVLSHEEQLDRLREAVPEAAHTAVVAGDPCFDRMRASAGLRSRYRALFGVDDQRVLVVVSSTWSSGSLVGSWPDLLRRLLAALPMDSYRVAAVVHPNVWHGHGPWQVRAWLADCLRAGLLLVPELEGWRAALIAADCVVGDNGAVTCYGAAIGRPVLLGAFPERDVAAGSPVDVLGRLAPRLVSGRPLLPQVEAAVAGGRENRFASVEELVSSVPDESPKRLRALFYGMLDLAEPESEPMLHLIPFEGIPESAVPRVSAVVASAEVDVPAREVRLVRYAAEVQPTGAAPQDAPGTHLVVHALHPGRRLRGHADAVFLHEHELGRGEGRPRLLADHPGAAVAAVIGDGRCTLRCRDGEEVEITSDLPDVDVTAWPSVVVAWLNAGVPLAGLAPSVRVVLGDASIDLVVRVSPLGEESVDPGDH
ncbi:hypothetical protein DFQ13_116149 [Actinokineospora spheciospongiae]|nr:hypothetical protein DFQ13_116149 [Actinokineospora spheciospongiae]